MRPHRSLLATVLLLCSLPALSTGPAPDAAAQIRQALTASAAAWSRGDIDGFMQTYWHSPQTEFIGSSGLTRGWETVRAHYGKNYPDQAAMGRLTFSDIEVTMLCPDAAYVVGRYRLDRAQDHPAGIFTLLWRRMPEGWRIVLDHTS